MNGDKSARGDDRGVVREVPRGEIILGGQRASRHFNGGAELLVRPKMLCSCSLPIANINEGKFRLSRVMRIGDLLILFLLDG